PLPGSHSSALLWHRWRYYRTVKAAPYVSPGNLGSCNQRRRPRRMSGRPPRGFAPSGTTPETQTNISTMWCNGVAAGVVSFKIQVGQLFAAAHCLGGLVWRGVYD